MEPEHHCREHDPRTGGSADYLYLLRNNERTDRLLIAEMKADEAFADNIRQLMPDCAGCYAAVIEELTGRFIASEIVDRGSREAAMEGFEADLHTTLAVKAKYESGGAPT